MRRLSCLFAAILTLCPGPAIACQMTCFDSGPAAATRPVTRVATRPAPRPVPRPTRAPTPRPTPGPAALAAALGLHAVTRVWAGDVVTRSGALTTYTSLTAQLNAGTYAKQVAAVSTGQRSGYDALLSNARTTLTDGRAVSGDIYANYVWSGSTLRLDRYVFFQDDRELAARRAPVPTATPAPTPTRAPVRPAAPPPAPPRVAPVVPPVPTPAPTPQRPRRIMRAGIALAPQGDILSRVEVLRGRRVDLWPRATVDGAPTRITSWRLIAGEVSALGPVSGGGDQPFRAMWETVRADGTPFEIRFSVTAEVADQPQRTVEAEIRVIVRSPALVE